MAFKKKITKKWWIKKFQSSSQPKWTNKIVRKYPAKIKLKAWNHRGRHFSALRTTANLDTVMASWVKKNKSEN